MAGDRAGLVPARAQAVGGEQADGDARSVQPAQRFLEEGLLVQEGDADAAEDRRRARAGGVPLTTPPAISRRSREITLASLSPTLSATSA